jgi:hypothetical protein
MRISNSTLILGFGLAISHGLVADPQETGPASRAKEDCPASVSRNARGPRHSAGRLSSWSGERSHSRRRPMGPEKFHGPDPGAVTPTSKGGDQHVLPRRIMSNSVSKSRDIVSGVRRRSSVLRRVTAVLHSDPVRPAGGGVDVVNDDDHAADALAIPRDVVKPRYQVAREFRIERVQRFIAQKSGHCAQAISTIARCR